MTVVDCHGFGIYTVILLPLLSLSAKMTASPRAIAGLRKKTPAEKEEAAEPTPEPAPAPAPAEPEPAPEPAEASLPEKAEKLDR